MNDDVQKYIYGTLTIFIFGVMIWVGFIFINACGFSLACKQAEAVVERTPIPTLVPATMPVLEVNGKPVLVSDACRVLAADLIGAWVSAKSPEKDAFQFVDVDGRNCAATFAEVELLFTEPNLWRSDSLSCVSCHSVDVTISLAQLDLSSYAGIMAGSRRENEKSKGMDILGGGDWGKSMLYASLQVGKADVPGHTQAVIADSIVVAGKPFVESVPTATPNP